MDELFNIVLGGSATGVGSGLILYLWVKYKITKHRDELNRIKEDVDSLSKEQKLMSQEITDLIRNQNK